MSGPGDNPPLEGDTVTDTHTIRVWRGHPKTTKAREKQPEAALSRNYCGSAGKESACNVGDMGSIPGLGRSPGEGKGFPLQYSGLENSMDCTAKSLQSCPTLCNPIDGSPPGSPVPGILQARTLELAAISFPNAWKWKVKVKSLCRVRPSATPWTAAHQAPPSIGFSRQEYWSGVPLPSPTVQSKGSQRVRHNWVTFIFIMGAQGYGSAARGQQLLLTLLPQVVLTAPPSVCLGWWVTCRGLKACHQALSFINVVLPQDHLPKPGSDFHLERLLSEPPRPNTNPKVGMWGITGNVNKGQGLDVNFWSTV